MSEKSAASSQQAQSPLVNQYKPVGIAAVNAAALCKKTKQQTK